MQVHPSRQFSVHLAHQNHNHLYLDYKVYDLAELDLSPRYNLFHPTDICELGQFLYRIHLSRHYLHLQSL